MLLLLLLPLRAATAIFVMVRSLPLYLRVPHFVRFRRFPLPRVLPEMLLESY